MIAGLEIGADDYITKPFSLRLLVTRSRTLLRRRDPLISTSGVREGEEESVHPVSVGPVWLDPLRYEATVAGRPLKLTVTEFRTLLFLTERAGWVSSRSRIVAGVHGADYSVTDRSVDVVIASLRKKLGDDAWRLETIRGVGFRMRE